MVAMEPGFLRLLSARKPMHERMDALQDAVSRLPQYEPQTEHYFHGGMYCRKVTRDANVIVIGKVHKQEHFYIIASGTVSITDGSGEAQEVTGPCVIQSMPGTRRAVTSLTPAVCLTFHRTDATTVEAAEAELVEPDERSMYLPGNVVKQENIEVSL